MKTVELKNTIDKMENLIRMQGIELDNTRNLLGRACDAFGNEIFSIERKEFDVPDDVIFTTRTNDNDINKLVLSMKIAPAGITPIMQQITKLREELGV